MHRNKGEPIQQREREIRERYEKHYQGVSSEQLASDRDWLIDEIMRLQQENRRLKLKPKKSRLDG